MIEDCHQLASNIATTAPEALEDPMGDIRIINDTSEADDREEQVIAQFLVKGCGCHLLNGSPCSVQFDVEHRRKMRRDCQGLSHNELDMVLMGHVISQLHSGAHTEAQPMIVKGQIYSFTIMVRECV